MLFFLLLFSFPLLFNIFFFLLVIFLVLWSNFSVIEYVCFDISHPHFSSFLHVLSGKFSSINIYNRILFNIICYLHFHISSLDCGSNGTHWFLSIFLIQFVVFFLYLLIVGNTILQLLFFIHKVWVLGCIVNVQSLFELPNKLVIF